MELFRLFGTIAVDNSSANDAIDGTADKAGQAEGKMSSAFGKIGNSAVAMGKVIASGIAVGATAIAGLAKKSLDSYADYEQLVGGVETLFKESGEAVLKYAEGAYKTAGLSANEYMETVTSFASSLIQSTSRGVQTNLEELEASLENQYASTKQLLEDEYDMAKQSWKDRIALAKKNKDANVDLLMKQRDEELKALKRANDAKLTSLKAYNKEQLELAEEANNTSVVTAESQALAVEKANQAIIDMADNANKMGSTMESIQNAYQGFAKQNYTMLDNLKLGYGGTKEEMQRLIDDANRVKEANGEMANLSIDSYADIVDAIHIIQKEMGIMGATKDEAERTISGSLSAMKSSFANLLTGFGNENADLSALTDQFVESFTIVMHNVMPRLQTILGGMASVIEQVMPIIAEKLPELLNSLLPSLIQGAVALLKGLVSALPTLLQILVEQAPFIITEITKALIDVFPVLMSTVKDLIGQLIDFIGEELFGVSDSSTIVFEKIGEAFGKLWSVCLVLWESIGKPIWEMISFALDSSKKLFQENMPAIKAFFADAIAGIKDTWQNHLKPIFDAIVKCLNEEIKPIFEYVWKKVIEPLVKTVFEFIANLWVDFLKPVFDGICDFLLGIFTSDWKKAFEGLGGILSGVFGAIVSVLKGAWGVIKTVINNIIDGIEWMVNRAKDGINGIIGNINNLIGKVGSVIGLEVAIPTLPDVKLPRLEQGGILEKGQIGFLEGNGAEAVVPLDQNEKWIGKVAQDMNGAIGGNEVLYKILDALNALRNELPEELAESIASMRFEINNREFARLVKGV